MTSIEGEAARSQPNCGAFAVETAGGFAENLQGSRSFAAEFRQGPVNHLPESHARLTPWRFFSHIPRLLSFGAAPKAAFGDAIRKAGDPSACALATKREEPPSHSKARAPSRCTPLPEGMFEMCSAGHTSGYRGRSTSLFRSGIEDLTQSSLSPTFKQRRSLQGTSSKSHQGYSP